MLSALQRSRAALAASLQGVAARCSSTSSQNTAAASPQSLYEVLGVDKAATPSDIKSAFRRRAKAVHPDVVHGAGRRLEPGADDAAAAAFLSIVEAYEVLSDPHRRRLYDASIDSGLPGVLRSAASASAAASAAAGRGQQQRAGGQAQQAHQPGTNGDLGWRFGLDDWAKNGPPRPPIRRGSGSGFGGRDSVLEALQRYRDTLEADLHGALLRAFFGPSLDGLQPGQLPPAFEAEERSSPGLSDDLLHLVSGRTLLGCVRLRRAPLLEGRGSATGASLGKGRDMPVAGNLEAWRREGGGQSRALEWVRRAKERVVAPPAPAVVSGAGSGVHGGDGGGMAVDVGLTREQLRQLLGGETDAVHACAAQTGGGMCNSHYGTSQLLDDQHRLDGAGGGSSSSSSGGSSSLSSGSSSDGGSTGPACAPRPGPGRWYSAAPCAVSGSESDGEALPASSSPGSGISSREGGGGSYPIGDGASAFDGCGGGGGRGGSGDEGSGASRSFEELQDERWREALLAAHSLKLQYDWGSVGACREPSVELLGPRGGEVPGSVEAEEALDAAQHSVRQQQQRQGKMAEVEDVQRGSLGAAALLRQWEQQMAAAAPAAAARPHQQQEQEQHRIQEVQATAGYQTTVLEGAPKHCNTHITTHPVSDRSVAFGYGGTGGSTRSSSDGHSSTDSFRRSGSGDGSFQCSRSRGLTNPNRGPRCNHDLEPPGFLQSLAEGLAIGLREASQMVRHRARLVRDAAPSTGHLASQQREQGGEEEAAAASGAAANTQVRAQVPMQHEHQHAQQPQEQQHHHYHHQQQQQHEDQHHHQQQQQQRLSQRAPSADWTGCSWDFDDATEGTTVVEAVVGPEGQRRVVGVAVRDDSQEQRPVKVYASGTFVAAMIQDAVVVPFTGEVLAILHRSWTPGVSHDIWFYRTRTPQPRLLARLRRRWLPPSHAWLFPPRDPSYDVGGWLIEWEGAGAGAKPGWLHPAVFVCAAALHSLDAEGCGGSWLQRKWREVADRVFPASGGVI